MQFKSTKYKLQLISCGSISDAFTFRFGLQLPEPTYIKSWPCCPALTYCSRTPVFFGVSASGIAIVPSSQTRWSAYGI